MSSLECFHCGEPADGEPPITLELDGQIQHFCCRGCKAVCETIRGEGLTGFYDLRTEPAVTPRQLSSSELDRLRELGELKDKGIITDAEFEKAKEKILNKE